MIPLWLDLIFYTLFTCAGIGIGYILGNARGRRIGKKQAMDELPSVFKR